jgi:hypothetical protein
VNICFAGWDLSALLQDICPVFDGVPYPFFKQNQLNVIF